MGTGKWRVDALDGGYFSLDGGAIFGVVPKTVWGNLIKPDEKNRIRLANRGLLARDGGHVILIDTGHGDKYPPLDRKAYEMDAGNPILDSLARLGVRAEDVTTVLYTHLHFDHAGGGTTYDEHRRLIPTFPNARYAASEAEWRDAINPVPELVTAYIQKDILPLVEHGVTRTVADGQELAPGFAVRQTGGHTRGHLIPVIETTEGTAALMGDICPTRFHIRAQWAMAYDTFLLTTRKMKSEILAEAAEGRWKLFWSHDPQRESCFIEKDRAKGFRVAAE